MKIRRFKPPNRKQVKGFGKRCFSGVLAAAIVLTSGAFGGLTFEKSAKASDCTICDTYGSSSIKHNMTSTHKKKWATVFAKGTSSTTDYADNNIYYLGISGKVNYECVGGQTTAGIAITCSYLGSIIDFFGTEGNGDVVWTDGATSVSGGYDALSHSNMGTNGTKCCYTGNYFDFAINDYQEWGGYNSGGASSIKSTMTTMLCGYSGFSNWSIVERYYDGSSSEYMMIPMSGSTMGNWGYDSTNGFHSDVAVYTDHHNYLASAIAAGVSNNNCIEFNDYYAWDDVSTVVDAVPAVEVSLNANGGSCSKSSVYGYPCDFSSHIMVGDLPTPTRSGYTFGGWYTASSGGTKIENGKTFNYKTTDLYAHWINCSTHTYTYSNKSDSGATGTCSVCGTTTNHTHTPVDGRTYTNSASGNCKNSYTWTCGTCGYSKTYDAVSHSSTYGGSSSVHTKCSNCGVTLSSSHSYTYTDSTSSVHKMTCACGYSTTGSHNSSSYGGTSGVHTKCSLCGRTMSSSHSYSYDGYTTTKHTLKCACGYSYTANHSYTYSSKTASGATGTCACGYSYTHTHTPSDGRTYTNDASGNCKDAYTWTCSTCGYQKTYSAISHSSTNGGTASVHKKCSYCGVTMQGSSYHSYTYSSKNSSQHTLTCACGYTYDENHDMQTGDTWIYDSAGTTRWHKCKKDCGYTKDTQYKVTVSKAKASGTSNDGVSSITDGWYDANSSATVSVSLKNGYKVTKWGSNTSSSTSYTVSSKLTGPVSITVTVGVVTYSITYSGVDRPHDTVTNSNPTSYTVESSDITLADVSASGYTFNGWTGNGTTTSTKKLVLKNGSYGNKTFTANWTANTNTKYTVIVHRQDTSGKYDTDKTDEQLYKSVGYTGTTDTTIDLDSLKTSYALTGFTYDKVTVASASHSDVSATSAYIAGQGNTIVDLYYTRNQYEFSTEADGEVSVDSATTDDGEYYYEEPITISATASSGYNFVKWVSSNKKALSNISESVTTFSMPAAAVALTATADDNRYNVAFHMNDDTATVVANNTKVEVVPEDWEGVSFSGTKTLPTVQRKGFTFLGWAKSSTATTATYSPGQSVSGLSSTNGATVDLYAVWSENTYTISFNANDSNNAHGSATSSASGSMSTTASYKYTQNVTLPANTYVRAGFTYLGWSTTKGSNTKIYSDKETVHGLSSDAGGSVTLYAAWNEHQYTIKFNANDSTATNTANNSTVSNPTALDSRTLYYTDVYTMPYNAYSRTGFTFNGWSTSSDSDAGMSGLAPGSSISKYSSVNNTVINVYAIWSENSYYIAFDDNDENNAEGTAVSNATGTMSKVGPYKYTENVTLKSNAFKRTGFSYKGWSLAKSNNDVKYSDGGTVKSLTSTDGDTVTLYAAWDEHQYTIKYATNDTTSYDKEHGGTNVSAVTNPAGMSSKTLYYTETYEIPKCSYSRKGFTFDGEYAKDSADSSTTYAVNKSVSMLNATDGGVVTLYPVWHENTYTIVFNANDKNNANNTSANTAASGSMDSISGIYYTQKIDLPANVYSRRGFDFEGWSLAQGVNDVTYYDETSKRGFSSTDKDVVTLYAAWTERQYTVKYGANDEYCYSSTQGTRVRVSNSSAHKTETVYYSDAWSLPECKYEREGFDFIGWTTNPDDVKKLYKASGSSYKAPYQAGDNPMFDDEAVSGTYTFYPVWKEKQYDIKFHENDGDDDVKVTGSMTDLTGVYYTQIVELPESGWSRKGHDFIGWSLTSSSHDDVKYAGDEVTQPSNIDEGLVDYYAVWSVKNYTLSFDANDGYCYAAFEGIVAKVLNSTAMESKKLASTDTYVIPECSYKRTGFTCIGWTKNPNDVKKIYEGEVGFDEDYEVPYEFGEEIAVADLFGDDSDVTLYPVWHENRYSIDFHANDENNAVDTRYEPAATGDTADIEDIWYTQSVDLTPNGFAREGFEYRGWSTTKSKNAVSYGEAQEGIRRACDGDGDVLNLWAAWREFTYTASFVTNDDYSYSNGKINYEVSNPDAMTTVKLYYTEGLPSETKYEREGFTFAGYSLTDDCSKMYGDEDYEIPWPAGTDVNRATNVDGGSVVLIPVWSENQYSITFHANDSNNASTAENEPKATGETKAITGIYYTQEVNLTENGFERTGFTYKDGWSTEESSNEVDERFTDGALVQGLLETDGDNLDLWCAWDEHSYEISYYANDAYSYGNDVADDDAEVQVDATGSVESRTVYYTDNYEVPECGFSRAGFTFKGWTTDKDDVKKLYSENEEYDADYEAEYQPGDVIHNVVAEDEGTLKLYPVWSENQYSVVFHANDKDNAKNPTNETTAEGSMDSMTGLYYTQSIKLTKNVFEREGFTYGDGWSLTESANDTNYADEEMLFEESVAEEAEDGVIDLWASWIENKYTLSFNANDSYSYVNDLEDSSIVEESGVASSLLSTKASGSADSVELYYTQNFKLSEEYARRGFTMMGWSTDSTDSQKYYQTDDFTPKFAVEDIVQRLSAEDGAEVVLYPVWREHRYEVSFDANDVANPERHDGETKATGSMEGFSLWYTEIKKLPTNGFSRAGFEYRGGWSTTKSSNSWSYADEDYLFKENSKDDASLVLYAAWTEKEYTIVFDANDEYSYSIGEGGDTNSKASGSIAKTTVKYTEDFEFPTNVFKRTGFTFVGWSFNKNDSKKTYDGEYSAPVTEGAIRYSMTDEDSITVYAVWKENSYTVKFHENQGESSVPVEGEMEDLNLWYTESASIPESGFSRKGYEAVGWSTTEGGSSDDYYGYDSFCKELSKNGSTLDLYVAWDAIGYNVVFDANGGEGEMKKVKADFDSDVVLPENEFERVGYDFSGWSLKKELTDGESADYADEATVRDLSDDGSDAVLYAVWTPKSYTISFDVNGGTGDAPESMDVVFDEEFSLPSASLTKEHFTFVGWSTEKTGGAEYEVNETVASIGDGSNVTLYAAWKGDPSKAIIHSGGSEEDYDVDREYKNDEPIDNQFSRPGYTVTGWTNSEDGNGKSWGVDEDVPSESTGDDVEYWAIWTANNYTIKFSANGGTGSMNSISAVYDKDVILPDSEFSRDGYSFVGWTLGDNEYAAGDTVKNLTGDPDGEVTLSAKWKANNYSIVFDANGGEGEMSSEDAVYDKEVKLTKASFTKKGYSVTGWSLIKDGEKKYDDGASVSNLATSGDVTLYAVWYANNYSIKLSDGTVVDAVYDEEATLPETTSTKTGYHSIGWALTEGGEKAYDAGDKVLNLVTSGSIQLYDVWEADKFTVVDSEGNESDEALFDNEGEVIQTDEEKTGYVPNGWKVEGTDIVIQTPEDLANLPDDAVIVPNWVANDYTIVLPDGNVLDATYDEDVVLPSSSSEKTGYHFVGWTTTEGGTAVEYEAGDSVSNLVDSGSTNLYEVWERDTFTVVDSDGKSESTELFDENDEVIQTTEEKSGYSANGWVVKGTDIVINSIDDLSKVPAGAEIEPNWVANTYTVTLGDGTVLDATYDENVVMPTTTTNSKPGYVLAGWSTTEGGKLEIATGESASNLAEKGNVTLYEVWVPATYEVSGSDDSTSLVDSDGNITQAADETGYTFEGWKVEGTDIVITSAEDLAKLPEGSVTLIPSYTANSYEVEVDGKTISTKYDETITLPEPSEEKAGYTFVGWSTTEGGDVEYEAGEASNLATSGSVKLYAVWTRTMYKVSGEDGESTSQELFDENGEIVPSTEEKTGYTFDGWKVEGTDKVITSLDDLAGLGSDVVITPNWAAIEYTIVFDANGGSGKMESVAAKYDKSVQLPANKFVYDGFEFAGWSTNPKGDAVWKDEANVLNLSSSNGDAVLYAVWKEKEPEATVTPTVEPTVEPVVTEAPVVTAEPVDNGDDDGNVTDLTPDLSNTPKAVEGITVGETTSISDLRYSVKSNIAGSLEVAVTFTTKKTATALVIPATVKINGNTFKVTEVKKNAFKNMTTLKSVSVGTNVKTIGKTAFYGCSSLKSVTIGKGVTKIDKLAFSNCKSLSKVTIQSKKLKSVGKGAFVSIAKKATIKVPKKQKSAYTTLIKKSGISAKTKIK